MSDETSTPVADKESFITNVLNKVTGYPKAVMDDMVGHGISMGIGFTIARRQVQNAVRTAYTDNHLERVNGILPLGKLPGLNVQPA